ncbi:MAG: Jag N-terminal domain-containing protein [Chloroflexi bacterium]|jgi:spoIIIJ-associated protein|nr:protein jag [Chloroflexota bacterium]MBV6437000.1 hypothetical protein [Anaerolineae bacterium]MDL1916205.1 KH domain-containing protein [Anaerolineae bacterium CFX4]OQY86162.1 MAG: hypothetical protein B6D42_01930 [Anaerolineae bacterium UTCFX5]MCC6565089.1 Jag N-terminal domain-containing protein [Chloroflexota bacterium]
MSERRSIEISADTVDEAIQRGLAELGVNPWDVMVEVVEEPTLGLFGSPPRQAKVRLQLLRVGPTSPPPSFPRLAQPDAEAARRQQSGNRQQGGGRGGQDRSSYSGGQQRREGQRGDRPQNRGDRGDRGGRGGRGRGDRDRRPVSRLLDSEMVRRQTSAFDDDSLYDDLEAEGESLFAGYTPVEESDYDADVAAAREMLVDVLKAMDISGSVQVSRVDASQGGGPWILNVQGQGRQINALIGRRGDTLAALQYILRLMVSHRLQHRVNLIVDVDGYKARRAERLRSLAARMAEQAISEARTVVLEPMPAHERRLIHIALRSHPQVETKSIGEGDNRKVTIVPVAGAQPSDDQPDDADEDEGSFE